MCHCKQRRPSNRGRERPARLCVWPVTEGSSQRKRVKTRVAGACPPRRDGPKRPQSNRKSAGALPKARARARNDTQKRKTWNVKTSKNFNSSCEKDSSENQNENKPFTLTLPQRVLIYIYIHIYTFCGGFLSTRTGSLWRRT